MKIVYNLIILLERSQFVWPETGRFDMRELKQPGRRRQQECDKFAYLLMKNSIFARFARAVFHFWTFRWRCRSFLRREMICFDKWYILYSYLWSAGSNLISGYLEHILQT